MCNLKKTLRELILSCIVTLVLNSHSFAEESIVIRFAHSAAPDSPKGLMATHFQGLVENEFSNGEVVVQVYPEGTLFDDEQLLSAVINNRAQIVVTPISNLQEFSSRFKLFDLPFLFVSEKAASRFLKGDYGNRLLRLINAAGVIGLGYLNDGMKQISSSQKVIVPEDAKNLKFLTSNSDVKDMFFRQINARPIVANLNKVGDLLKNKIAEGQESTWSNIRTRAIYQYQEYILESNHVYLADVILASVKSWEKIPKEQRIVIQTQLEKAIEYGNRLAQEQALKERALIMDSSQSEVFTLSTEERGKWVDAMQGVWKKFEDEFGAELIGAAASSR